MVGLFLDLKKAFDSINSQIILTIPTYYRLRGVAHNWFSSYMIDYSRYVYVNGCKSSLRLISTVEVQGNINLEKFNYMVVSTMNLSITQISLKYQNSNQLETTKYLGVIIDNRLIFKLISIILQIRYLNR